jgi:hypothetical protein
MLYHMLIAVLAVVALALVWVAVQALERASKHLSRDTDVLGCWMCEGRGGCHCALRGFVNRTKSEGTDR